MCLTVVGFQAESSDFDPPYPCLSVAAAAFAAENVAVLPALPLLGLKGKCPVVVVAVVGGGSVDGLAFLR